MAGAGDGAAEGGVAAAERGEALLESHSLGALAGDAGPEGRHPGHLGLVTAHLDPAQRGDLRRSASARRSRPKPENELEIGKSRGRDARENES